MIRRIILRKIIGFLVIGVLSTFVPPIVAYTAGHIIFNIVRSLIGV